jgi:cytochrome c oxidase accessory protein FixG
MEMVFRRIEHWIEGDANQQRKLDNAAWTTEKIMKKTAKHTLFLLVSFLIANTFLAYLVGSKELLKLVTHSPFEHLTLFVSLLVFTGAFYIVFAKVRELVCIVACPYGRLQSVLLDNKSMVIAYDFVRGEPRGKLKKNTVAPAETPKQGDCIDCKLCVQVCPTGIDIRNGTQLECINCTACIDACDDVMDKIGKPKKLIRYDSMEGITENKPFGFTKRMASYSVVLVLLMTLLSYFLITRKPLDVVVMRTQGQLYQEIDSVTVSNLYNVEFVNKTPETMKVWLRVKDLPAKINWVNSQTTIEINSGEVLKTTLFIETSKKTFNKTSNKIVLEVMNGDEVLTEAKTTFLAPMTTQ